MARVRRSLVMLLVALVLLVSPPPALAQGGGHTVVGQEYTLAAGEQLDGDLVVLGGRAQLKRDSVVNGNVTVLGGEALIEGRVRCDVVAMGGTLELGAGAEVGGDMVAFGTLRRHAEAAVRGDVVTGPGAVSVSGSRDLARMFDGQVAPRTRPSITVRTSTDASELVTLLRQILALATAVAAAALITMLFPANLTRVSNAMSTAWLQSAGVGALTGVVALVLAPVLAITIIGLPVSLVLLVALGLSALLGWTGAGQLVGAYLARAANLRLTSSVATAMLGVSIISLITMLPCLGLLAALAVAAWGLGAVVLTRLGTRTYVPAPLPPQAADGGPTAPRSDTRPLDPLADEGPGSAE